ncbi:MAG: hypothetical protein L3J24_09575 [Xanthomonadales bacterium]|nr:hypothetical protein [Xanthomonadales bacterium]
MFNQPVAGIVATVLIMALSLGFISLFSFELFTGWVSYSLMCIIPTSIMVGVVWGRNPPEFIAKLEPPTKGLCLLAVTFLSGLIAGSIMFYVVGGGLTPLAPMLIHFTIVTIGTMFWLTIIMGAWPILPNIKSPVLAGLVILVVAHVISFALFQLFYSYEFLAETPIYVARLDPRGLFNAWEATVFYVSFITMMFVILHLDLWPLTKAPALMKQPMLGLVFTIVTLCLSVIIYYLALSVFKLNVVTFMATVLIPFVFGSVIILNMLQDSLFSKFTQPLKGILKISLALIVGLGLAKIFFALSALVTRELGMGPPSFEREIWLASALLSVTFPFLLVFADYFQFGGLLKKNSPAKPE